MKRPLIFGLIATLALVAFFAGYYSHQVVIAPQYTSVQDAGSNAIKAPWDPGIIVDK